MATREASCSCGNLKLMCEGDPRMVIACHCRDCQRRTGSVFGVGAYFRNTQVSASGADKIFVRDAQNGRKLRAHFCPACGTSVYWEPEFLPGHLGVAVGAFADPTFPLPTISVWEESRHAWLDFEHEPARQDRQAI